VQPCLTSRARTSEWQAALGRTLAPRTVRHHRQTLAQIVDEAVKMGVLVGNPVRAVKPVRVTDSAGVALEPDETRALLDAVGEHRLAAAVALLFLQGWRVSEALGLAWEDVDLDAGTAHVRRASVYVDGHGQRQAIAKLVKQAARTAASKPTWAPTRVGARSSPACSSTGMRRSRTSPGSSDMRSPQRPPATSSA
jgi:integrase